MKIYDPTTRENVSADFTLSDSVEAFLENDVEWNYEAQSQMQIAAGDFDNDTVDEIAVYVPASQGGSARVATGIRTEEGGYCRKHTDDRRRIRDL